MARVEIVVADTGDMSGSSGDVPGPAGAHELRLLQRIAACNGGAMWVAVDGAVSSGVLRIPVKKQAGRSVLSQIGWPSFRATGEGDGEGDGEGEGHWAADLAAALLAQARDGVCRAGRACTPACAGPPGQSPPPARDGQPK